MWTYRQSDGFLLHNGVVVGEGYSGYGTDKNQPNDESVKNLGPIPHGTYTIGAPECVGAPGPHGPFVLPLTPNDTTTMFGRSGFKIHGDSIEHPGSASQGCIIMSKPVRVWIAQSDDHDLEVIA